MTEAQVIKMMREHLESQFPKVCSNCNRRFETLREYIKLTKRIEPPVSYDAEMGDWNPKRPLGTATYSNCPCGSTLALSSHGMPVFRLWSLYNWARVETRKRGVNMQQLLIYLRNEIRDQIQAESDPPNLPEEPGAPS
ncbi:MAG: hypothetical protein ABSE62_04245 [Chthoniobacteraceae bacterium]|jgi:hypothetical protein